MVDKASDCVRQLSWEWRAGGEGEGGGCETRQVNTILCDCVSQKCIIICLHAGMTCVT